MPGKYDRELRQITLETTVEDDASLTIATLIQMTVLDFLTQIKFSLVERPEILDMAVVATGLGVLRSKIKLVETFATFWDISSWDNIWRPFLDGRAFAHVAAISAWSRNQPKPNWLGELHPDIQSDVKKSLKYLNKTGDCFVQPSTEFRLLENRKPTDWVELANSKSQSEQVIALFNMPGDATDLENLLIDKLRSRKDAIVLHAIGSIHRLDLNRDSIVDELRLLVHNSNDDIRAKALLVLGDFAKVDPDTMEQAKKMLSSRVKHVEYAAIGALSTLDNIPDTVLQSVEQGLVRSLQFCNYEMLGCYLFGLDHWLEEPEPHLENILIDESPEYLRIAIETLDQMRNPEVAAG